MTSTDTGATDDTTATGSRFVPGTFTPAPRANRPQAMLAAQARLELLLLLRNSEQLLLTMLIPTALLVGLALLPLGSALGAHRIDAVMPEVVMVAVMSTAFTGQAIAVGFDRRYGALKRLGATALPRWGIIAGKSAAVAAVVVIQAVLFGVIGLTLGWRPVPAGLLLGAVIIALGTAMFAALGLLLGGTLKAEVVLALANIAWFVLLGIGSLTLLPDISHAAQVPIRLIPSAALTNALHSAARGSVDWYGIAVLCAWSALFGKLATRLFRFD